MSKRAERAAKEIGKGARALAGDVTDLPTMERAAKATAEAQGGLDILCANAGIFPLAKIEEMTPEQWDEVVNTNLKGTYLSVKAALPYLKKSDQGRIVLTSSITGPITGFPGWTHYGATKVGTARLHAHRGIELAKYGITVNAVLPGNILTEGLSGVGRGLSEDDGGLDPAEEARHRSRISAMRCVPRLQGGRLHHRPVDHRRWRPDIAGIA